MVQAVKALRRPPQVFFEDDKEFSKLILSQEKLTAWKDEARRKRLHKTMGLRCVCTSSNLTNSLRIEITGKVRKIISHNLDGRDIDDRSRLYRDER